MIDLRNLFAESGLDIVFRVDNTALWAAAYSRLNYRPVRYLDSAMDYQLAYQRGKGGEWQELSCVLLSNNKPVAIWPITVAVQNGVASLSSQGQPVMPPLFVKECPKQTQKRLTADSLRFASHIAAGLGLADWQSAPVFSDYSGVDEWQQKAMSQGTRCAVRYELYVDLRMTLSEIKSGIRKSFRSLITSGGRLWHVEILRAPGDIAVWEEFRLLHAEVAGRVTRSMESWHLQHEALAADQGFLVVLRDSGGTMVGAGYFMCSPDEGFYAVAAYNRSLFEKPLGHVVQYYAIAELQRRSCRWYHIGRRSFPCDDPAPNTKELSISVFKEGFASHVFPSFLLTHPAVSVST